MAKKISDLPAVATPAATDQLEVNQGGVSKRETRAQIHTLQSGEHLVLPAVDEAATPTLQFGNTGIYGGPGDSLRFATGGSFRVLIDSIGRMLRSSGRAAVHFGTDPSGTTPIFTYDGDFDSGLGRFAADNPSMIAGGIEAARFEDPADLAATETALWIYDLDNAAIQQVTVGAADSGGVGFKLLRIPN